MKKLLFLIFPFLFFTNLYSQYIDKDGEIIIERMVSDLKVHKLGSDSQNVLINEMVLSIMSARKIHPALKNSNEKKLRSQFTVEALILRTGEFQFLNLNPIKLQYSPHTDTLSAEILSLEKKLKLLIDSIENVYSALKEITLVESINTRATKEKAAILLGTSNNLSDITFVFEKNNELNFELIDYSDDHLLSFYRLEGGGKERTAMSSLISDKLYPMSNSKDIIDRNWILFPFFIKYWGDDKWRGSSSSISGITLETNSFIRFTSGYSKPWLLLQFMEANMENPDNPIIKHLNKIYLNREK